LAVKPFFGETQPQNAGAESEAEREAVSEEVSVEAKDGASGASGARRLRRALLCVALCIACLAGVFLFLKNSAPAETDIALLSSQDDGRFVAVYGALAAPRLSATGFHGTLCGGGCISFFVPPQLAEEISNSRVDLAKLRSGAKLRVEGVVREDNRGLSLDIQSVDSVELLG